MLVMSPLCSGSEAERRFAKRSRTTVTQSVHQTRDGEVQTEDRSESAADR
jgi:hypothetical protein